MKLEPLFQAFVNKDDTEVIGEGEHPTEYICTMFDFCKTHNLGFAILVERKAYEAIDLSSEEGKKKIADLMRCVTHGMQNYITRQLMEAILHRGHATN
jgi:hypothetical protein